MGDMNLLSKDGLTPTWDVYSVTPEVLGGYFNKMIKLEYGIGVPLHLVLDLGSEENPIRVSFDDVDDIPEEIQEKMQDDGMDPEDSDEILDRLLFVLGGGSDTLAEYGGTHDGKPVINVFVHPRRDVASKLIETLDVALEGSRDESVIAINKLLKYVKRGA